jgi:hypothetical protein
MSVSGGDGLERAASECALQSPPSWRITEGPSFLPFVLFLKATPAKDDYYRYTKMHHASERGNSYMCINSGHNLIIIVCRFYEFVQCHTLPLPWSNNNNNKDQNWRLFVRAAYCYYQVEKIMCT